MGLNSYLDELERQLEETHAKLINERKKITAENLKKKFLDQKNKDYLLIESVSKMLGHLNIKTTQHYAKVIDEKVGRDMQALQRILDEEVSRPFKRPPLECKKFKRPRLN